MKIVDIITNKYGLYPGDLKEYFRVIMVAPNAVMPYHNTRHTLHVTWEAYDGAVSMGLLGRSLRNVLIASMFHDYGHSGGKMPDSSNIEAACEGFNVNSMPMDRGENGDIILDLIRETEFPYKGKPKTELGALMRDADMSQTFSPAWIQSILYGLGTEMNKSYMEMLKMQVPFLYNLRMYTQWGQDKFHPMIENRLAEVSEMIRILKEVPSAG